MTNDAASLMRCVATVYFTFAPIRPRNGSNIIIIVVEVFSLFHHHLFIAIILCIRHLSYRSCQQSFNTIALHNIRCVGVFVAKPMCKQIIQLTYIYRLRTNYLQIPNTTICHVVIGSHCRPCSHVVIGDKASSYSLWCIS